MAGDTKVNFGSPKFVTSESGQTGFHHQNFENNNIE